LTSATTNPEDTDGARFSWGRLRKSIWLVQLGTAGHVSVPCNVLINSHNTMCIVT
jgi:hypothetical protein